MYVGDDMKRPVIGITASHDNEYREYRLKKKYSEAIYNAGGIPFILPVITEKKLIKLYIEKIDGLLLSGGLDVDPLIYGENPLPTNGSIDPERDLFELDLFKEAHSKGIAILGICKGCQIINIAAGGTLYQDIYNQIEGVLKHKQEAPRWYPTHRVNIDKGTYLYHIIEKEKIRVNSIHHQAIKKVGPGFIVSARSDDGVIEAIEEKNGFRFIIGVQWHPETMWGNYSENYILFKEFIRNSL